MVLNKKGLAIPIGILTVLVILLIVYTSYYVLARERNVRGEIDVSVMDKLYVSELELNFILENIFERVSEDALIEGGEDVFVRRFLEELKSYKVGDKYSIDGLEEIENEIGESVEFVDVGRKIILSVDVVLVESGEGVKVSYDYKRVFERVV